MDINPYEAPRSSGLKAKLSSPRFIHPFTGHFVALATMMLALVACGANIWLPYYYALRITEFSTLGKPIVAIVGLIFCRGILQWMFAAILVLDLVCVAIGFSFDQMEGRLLPRDSIIWMLPIQLILTAGIVWPSLLVAAHISKRESTARVRENSDARQK
jgi:hypothetical protein